MKEIRVAVIGCGFFARFHLHSWQDLAREGIRIVAVCDRDGERVRRATTDFGIPHAYTDATAMFDAEEIDLVDIATGVASHRPLVELALRRRLATIVQKPMAPYWDDCAAMVKAADEAGVFFAVHENFRYQTPMQRIRAIIDSGEIGTPSWARIGFRTGLDVYRAQPYLRDEERLVILDLGIHILDLARFLLGEVAHVSCETQRRNLTVRAEDTATMLLRHRSGAVSLAECTYENRRSDAAEIFVEVEASAGGIDMRSGGVIEVTTSTGKRVEPARQPSITWATPPLHFVQESVLAACRALATAFREGRQADTSGRDNLKTLALVEAAYRGAAEARAIEPAV